MRKTAVTAVAIAVLAAPSAALATTTDDPAQAAAGWLGTQLADDQRLVGSWTDADGTVNEFDDHGGTADVVYALAAAGVGARQIAAAVDWLISQADLATGSAFGATSAGSTAKLALAVMVDGRDPRAVGGDLLRQLSELERPDGTHAGRFSDGGDDDWSNTIGQALAILALTRAEGIEPSTTAVEYLISQQCADGGFPFTLHDGGCDQATAIDGDLAVDTTLIAIQALAATGNDVTAAVDWVIETLGADGPGNANTAGLAAVAFDIGDRRDAAHQAREIIAALQEGCDAQAPGAIAYSSTAEGDLIFATRQAVLGLASDGRYLTISSQSASEQLPALACGERGWLTTVAIVVGAVAIVAAVLVVVGRRRVAS